MDPADYRRICSAPDVMKRSDLAACETELRKLAPKVADSLVMVMKSAPIPRPASVQGTRDDDFFNLDLAEGEIEAIEEVLRDREISFAQDGTELSNASARYFGRLADLWSEAESMRPVKDEGTD